MALDRVLHGNLPIRTPAQVLAEREAAQRRAIAVNIATVTPDVALGPLHPQPAPLGRALLSFFALASAVWVAFYLILYYAL